MAHSRWIARYPDVPQNWLVKASTSLTQVEVDDLEVGGFKIDDGFEFFDKLIERL
jgi:hypothetical protein